VQKSLEDLRSGLSISSTTSAMSLDQVKAHGKTRVTAVSTAAQGLDTATTGGQTATAAATTTVAVVGALNDAKTFLTTAKDLASAKANAYGKAFDSAAACQSVTG